MKVSQATINPAMGSISVTVGSDDEGVDLSTRHLLAPWPVDDHCRSIAVEALKGMGWTVLGGDVFTGNSGDPDAAFVLDVAPAG